jgi:hypothetical protein
MRASVRVARGGAQGAIETWLASTTGRRAVLVEGALEPLHVPDDVPLTRLSPGCVCCVGLVPLKVGITRAVRAYRPESLLLVLSAGEHLQRVRELLANGSLGVRFELD